MFHKLKKFCITFLRDDQGQSTTEYILLLSVVVVGSTTLLKSIINAIDTGILTLGGQLERDLKTGRAKLATWKN